MIATAREEVLELGVAEDVDRLADVDLPEDVGDAEAGDDERRADPDRAASHPVKAACTRRSASIASSMSASECAGESGSDSTSAPARSATGSGGWSGKRSRYAVSRWTGRKWTLVPMFSSASASRYSSRVAPASALDPHDVEVERVQVARVARQRVDPVQLGDGRVVDLDLPQPDRPVPLDLVELAERDRGEHVGEVGLVPGHRDVVERAVAAAHDRQRRGSPRRARRSIVVDDPALAGGDRLRRVEREARRLGEPADLATAVLALGGVRGVLDHRQAEREIGSRSAGCPDRWTGMIAFVRGVTSPATRSGSMFRSVSRTSAKTGVAPVWTITFAVAGQVIGVVITSSPGPTPSATSERCIAAVPEETASACFAPTYSAKRSLELGRARPGRQPARAERLRDGSDLLLADRGRLEAEEGLATSRRQLLRGHRQRRSVRVRRAASARERLRAARADGEHRARAVGAAPQRAEHGARAAR